MPPISLLSLSDMKPLCKPHPQFTGIVWARAVTPPSRDPAECVRAEPIGGETALDSLMEVPDGLLEVVALCGSYSETMIFRNSSLKTPEAS